MASENEIKKLNEVSEKNELSESIKMLQEQNLTSRKDVHISDLPPLISSPGDALSINQKQTYQELLVSNGDDCPQISIHGYAYAGRDGVYPKLDSQEHFGSLEGLKIPYSVYNPAAKVPSHNNQGRGQLFLGKANGNFRSNDQPLVGNDRDKLVGKFNRSRGFDVSNEATRGPRAYRMDCSKSFLTKQSSLDSLTRGEKYNLQDFQIKYDEAKFFMIKSFSEYDVHKSIKYNVWSSTPYGNKKLDAAFRDAEARVEGTKFPIFLFFSVNSSGQFIGLAEMTGPVDFNKSMDFWQEDKWQGFFPVKWHIIKDIPNSLFRSIILENNDYRAVTYSRDTQEIGLPQGLKMLQIFKTFQAKTLILDDFGFYEEKEKSLRAARRNTALEHRGGGTSNSNSSLRHPETARRTEFPKRSFGTPNNQRASLVAITKNLSLNARQ